MSRSVDAIPQVLHAVDSAPEDAARTRRQQWLRLLARAPIERLERALSAFPTAHIAWLRKPETGLMMVRGRIGGTGDRFNLGELTVTRCALRVTDETGSATAGVAYVLGRSARQAELAALADALLQTPTHGARLQRTLLEPQEANLAAVALRSARQVQATRVEFFTVARETAA